MFFIPFAFEAETSAQEAEPVEVGGLNSMRVFLYKNIMGMKRNFLCWIFFFVTAFHNFAPPILAGENHLKQALKALDIMNYNEALAFLEMAIAENPKTEGLRAKKSLRLFPDASVR